MTIQYIAPIHLDGIEFLWQNYHSRGILNYMRGRPEEAITDLKVCILPFYFQIACEERERPPPPPLPTSFRNFLMRQIEKPESVSLNVIKG